MEGKTAIVLGVWNQWSIAYAIAQAFVREGATLLLTYQNERAKPTVEELGQQIGAAALFPCDVQQQSDIDQLAGALKASGRKLDVVVHSIAFANREDLGQPFVNTSREGFKLALDVSAYSLVAVTKALAPLMTDGGSIMTLTYLGSTRVVTNYNVMGVAKAALEAEVKYLASELGASKIRVNAISAGPIKTISARGIKDFSKVLDFRRATRAAAPQYRHRRSRGRRGFSRQRSRPRRDGQHHLRRSRIPYHGSRAGCDVAASSIEILRSVFRDVLELDTKDRPIRAKREAVGPFDDHDGILGKNVFEAESFQIVKISDAI